MPLRILDLGKQFRLGTSHVYPPFKNGRYMEEYCYDVLLAKKDMIQTDVVYIPIFWTNLQNHPGFSTMKSKYQVLLTHALKAFPPTTTYMTIVQHDDGPQLQLPKDTIIFGACTGTVPLPLIYEDVSNRLVDEPRCPKTQLASFVGTLTTHSLRDEVCRALQDKDDIVWNGKNVWSAAVQKQDADVFIKETLQSYFCLAPRGYGRSSFRFFEAMLMDTVPVYVWDDIEWLPYKEVLDYSTFAISISRKDVPNLYDILSSISDKTYEKMVENLKKNRHWFTLEGMMEYIIQHISKKS